jgi:hypothetical protein
MVIENPQATLDLELSEPIDGIAVAKQLGGAAPDALPMPPEGGEFVCGCGQKYQISPGTSQLDCQCGRSYKFVFKADAIKPLTFAIIELTKPGVEGGIFRAKIDSYEGEGGDAKSAIVAALCGAGLIHVNGQGPEAMYGELMTILTEQYKENSRAKAVALAMTNNTFDVSIPTALDFEHKAGDGAPEANQGPSKSKRRQRKPKDEGPGQTGEDENKAEG